MFVNLPSNPADCACAIAAFGANMLHETLYTIVCYRRKAVWFPFSNNVLYLSREKKKKDKSRLRIKMRSTSTDTRILRKKLHKGGKTRLKVAGGDNHRSVHSGFSERPPASSIANGEVLSRMGRVCENWFAVCDQDIPRSKSRSNNDALLLGSIGIRRVPGSAHDESKHSTQQLLVLQLQDFNNVSKIILRIWNPLKSYLVKGCIIGGG